MAQSKIVVVDTSVIVKWLNRDNERLLEQADKVFQDGESGKIEIFAPELSKYEAGNSLLYKKLDVLMVKVAIEAIFRIPMAFVPLDEQLAKSALEIAVEEKITYYDATFMALAKKFDAVLITDNIKHQKSASGVKVIALKDY